MDKAIFLVISCNLFCACVCVLVVSTNDEICKTPEQKFGLCIEISKCASLAYLTQERPLSPEHANYLKQSQCGFEKLEPKICCAVDGDNEVASAPLLPSSVETISSNNNNILPDTYTCGLHEYNVVLGSTQATIKEFPWTVLLEYEKPSGRGFHCGGTLISNKYVLTSGHCVARLPESWKLVSVRLGEYNLDTDIDCYNYPYQPNVKQCTESPLDVSVAERIVHEDYDPNSYSQLNDIALLRLSKAVTFTDFIRPICLPTSSELLRNKETGSKLTVAGWGVLSETENRSHSRVKLKSMVTLTSKRNCSSVYSAIHVNINGQLCTEEQTSCTVDSGGPLMIHKETPTGFNWYIVGVQSFGPTPCGYNNWPEVYTTVPDYLQWIAKNLKR